MVQTYEELKREIQKSGKPYDLEKIDRAYALAAEAHREQKRKSGEPYIIHPLSVSEILVGLGMDTDSVVAALLHDVVEDTDTPLEELRRRFGADVALLVDGVTKLGKVPLSTREEQQAENVRKMLLAMAQDVRVIIIKLADRLHNMRTLSFMPQEKRLTIALETMEVYAPLAHRLGITEIKEELEDTSLRYLDPVAYDEIQRMLKLRQAEREAFLESIRKRIAQRLQNDYGEVYLQSRVKSAYGIYRKVYMQGRDFEEIYDIYAIRIIVNSVFECYNILGIIHDMFRPLPNRFKDYISTPKQNMYQSLHTTVIDKEGIPFEVQIRTWEMHHTAEYGIAAHWKYKAGISGRDKLEERLAWVRRLLETQQETGDAEDIVRAIKTDFGAEEVFVFTPKGDVITLPSGSTVIDFAYAIHTQVGNRMVGAKIDGRMVSLSTEVATGNIVEVITTNARNHGPSRDWLGMVKTSEARNKIRSWFKKERREENIQQGRQELESEFKRYGIRLEEPQLGQFILEVAKRQHFQSIEDFYAAIGYGGVSLSRIMQRVRDDYQRNYTVTEQPPAPPKPKRERRASGGVVVAGLEDCLVKFARCCNPLPGDAIVGFVTRGYGVSIHKADCLNVVGSISDPAQRDRWVEAHWANVVREKFKSTISILAQERESLLADVSTALMTMHVPITSLVAKELKDHMASIQITCTIENLDQLRFIIGNLSKIAGVERIERANQ